MSPKRALQAYALKERVKVKLRDDEITGTIIGVSFERQTKFNPGERKRDRHRIGCKILDSNKTSVFNCWVEDVLEIQNAPLSPFGEDIVNNLIKFFQI